MLVQERMTKDCCSCRAEDRLSEAARQLWEHDCGSLPVVDDEGHVQGMLTDRDICMAAYTTGKSLAELRVDQAMATVVATISAAETLRGAELVMRSHGVRRLPVVDENGCLVGILSLNDLFRWTDDPRAGATTNDAVHLVRTVATLGSARHPRDVAASNPRARSGAAARRSEPRSTAPTAAPRMRTQPTA